MRTPEEFNRLGEDYLPGQLGIRVTHVDLADTASVTTEFTLSRALHSPNDTLHCGAVMVLADTAAGYGSLASLPPGASGFLTIEMKSNHLGTASTGVVECVARTLHRGRSTQVWDAVVRQRETGRTLALFRCTQLILYPQAATALVFRELEAVDNLPVRDLVMTVLNQEYGMALSLDELPDLADVHASYQREGLGNFWVACDGERIVGCIGLCRLSGADFELRRMYTHAQYRGRGIAKRLLELALDWSRRHGVGCLYLETNEQWKAAHHLYEKHGFTPVAQAELPPQFPVVRVATGFYRLRLSATRLMEPSA